MENIANNDFDRLENLLRKKRFDQLTNEERQWVLKLITQDEYCRMSELHQITQSKAKSVEITPNPETGTHLRKALREQVRSKSVLLRRMPVYQSAAAAIVFLFIGMGIQQKRPSQTRIVQTTKEVIKYIDCPVKEIQYVTVRTKSKKVHPSAQRDNLTTVMQDSSEVTIPQLNPEILRQQEIAMNNLNRVLNEKNGSSMGGDTLLQKMMVTLY